MNDQQLVDYDWMIGSHGTRLHHVTLPDDAGVFDGLGPVTAACGRVLHGASIPGVFTRMGAARCTGCCKALGLPPGAGSPKNDVECRRILGWDTPPTAGAGE